MLWGPSYNSEGLRTNFELMWFANWDLVGSHQRPLVHTSAKIALVVWIACSKGKGMHCIAKRSCANEANSYSRTLAFLFFSST